VYATVCDPFASVHRLFPQQMHPCVHGMACPDQVQQIQEQC